MKIKIILIFAIMSAALAGYTPYANAESTRKERRLIMKGNDLYKERKFVEAQSVYEEALRENSASAEAQYNLGLSQIRQVTSLKDSTSNNGKLATEARRNFSNVAAMAKTKPGLASKANFNLGNIEFNSEDYAKAISYYKQALRINPNDEKARKNLRIAQLKLQNQNQDKNKDQQQDQDNKQNQDKDKNKDQNQNQNQNKDQQQKNEQQNQKNLSQQAASQILQAVDNKENQTRARVNKASKGEKSVTNGRNTRKW